MRRIILAKYTMIEKDLCAACASCVWVAPEIYKIDENGTAACVLDENKGIVEVPEHFYEDIETAQANCPTGAIKIREKPFKGNRQMI